MGLEEFPPAGAVPALPETTVLVVDDEPQTRRAIVRMLKGTGLVAEEAGSVVHGTVRHSGRMYDVIVSDIRMPGGDGFELLRTVRTSDPDVPIILMTALPDVATAAMAVEYGAFRYITKPVRQEVLIDAVRHAARNHRMARLHRVAFEAGLHAQPAAGRAALAAQFDRALAGLWVAYQPIVSARSGALFGVEALLRSDEPTMSRPLDVLDAATSLDRLAQLGRRVRTLAAAGISADRPGVFLFINVHSRDLLDEDLVSAAAPLSGIASRVVLEITMSDSLEPTPAMRVRLTELRRLGFRLAIDDIGAGYSSLTAFADVMPEVIKVDMSLIRDIDQSEVRRRTVRLLCSLAHDCGGLVVAEGVETEAERDCVRDLGCDLMQGYLIGRPKRELPSWRSEDTQKGLQRIARRAPDS
jgi:EAL domain-containing protein (putative c-di-GMP-specific phosphodiesterase class I)